MTLASVLATSDGSEHLVLVVIARATAVLLLGSGAVGMLRRSSATLRHGIWTLALAGVVGMPLLTFVLPPVAVRIPTLLRDNAIPAAGLPPTVETSRETSAGTTGDSTSAIAPRTRAMGPQFDVHAEVRERPMTGDRATSPVANATRFRGRQIVVVLWLVGCLLALARFGAGLVIARQRLRRAGVVTSPQWLESLEQACRDLGLRRRVQLLQSAEQHSPLTMGWRPVVLLPVDADAWPAELRYTILLHELAHVRRHDWSLQTLLRALCTIWWFHPLVWYALRQLRRESERAADDMVLTVGVKPTTYAQQLLNVAIQLGQSAAPPSWAVAMAHRSGLEQRIRCVLDARCDHHAPTARKRWLVLCGGFIGILMLAALTVAPAAAYREAAGGVPADERAEKDDRETVAGPAGDRRRVLIVEDWRRRGDFEPLVKILQRNQWEVDVTSVGPVLSDLQKLKRYDTVVLADLPRSSGEYARTMAFVTDGQIANLVRNTRELGCGLVMIGGSSSFGAGGWAGTELEQAMPVQFKWAGAAAAGSGAVALLMHPAELPRGNQWQRVAARAAVTQLGPQDFCGLLYCDQPRGMTTAWLWGKNQGVQRVGARRQERLDVIDRLTSHDLMLFDVPLQMALRELQRVKAPSKQLIVLTDGDPAAPKQATLAAFRRAKIAITVVHIDLHGPFTTQLPQRIATATGGRYYYVHGTEPKLLERVFHRETRRMASGMYATPAQPIVLKTASQHAILRGLKQPLPAVGGIVVTRAKKHPSVQVPMVASLPGTRTKLPVLATWQFGVGRTAVLTPDVVGRSSRHWQQWESFERLAAQIVAWTARARAE